MRKWLSKMVAVLIVFSMFLVFACPAFAAGDVDYYEYEIEEYEGETAAIITGYNHKIQYSWSDGYVEIPKELGGYPVRVIGDGVFKDQPELWWVVIPEGVKEIGACAFQNCTYMKMIEIGRTVQKIDDTAFSGCDTGRGGKLTIFAYEDTHAVQYAVFHNIEYKILSNIQYEEPHTSTEVSIHDTRFSDRDVKLKAEIITEGKELETLAVGLEGDKVLYNISLEMDGQVFYPQGDILVDIVLPDSINGYYSKVYWVEEDGTLTDMKARQGSFSLTWQRLCFWEKTLGKYLVVGTHMFGDTDRDCKITVNDALKVLKLVVNLESCNDSEKETADVDGDGEITVNDALFILKRTVNLIRSFPMEDRIPV